MSERTASLLIVEDDVGIRNQLKWALDGFDIAMAGDRAEAIAQLRLTEPPIVLLDLGLPPDPGGASEGLATLEEIIDLAPRTKVIVITGNDERAHAVRAIGLGAHDFYNKPIDADVLSHVVDRARRVHELERENERLQRRSAASSSLDGVIAISESMTKVCRDIEKLAPSDIGTLLLGESGTGKELLARALHELSPRADGRLVAINCAAIPSELLESELFGHEKGAFTGAAKQTRGKLEYADGGTLFLDEIGDLPLALQAKLLRFLQERKIERVGGRTEIEIDTRVISATHKDVQQLIDDKLFREDLYFRLGEVSVKIPPLRERRGDVPVLAKAFLERFAAEMKKPTRRFSDGAIDALEAYRWPGNIRELENRIKRATVMAEGKVVTADDLGLADGETYENTLNLREVREKAERAARHARARAHRGQHLACRQASRRVATDALRHHGSLRHRVAQAAGEGHGRRRGVDHPPPDGRRGSAATLASASDGARGGARDGARGGRTRRRTRRRRRRQRPGRRPGRPRAVSPNGRLSFRRRVPLTGRNRHESPDAMRSDLFPSDARRWPGVIALALILNGVAACGGGTSGPAVATDPALGAAAGGPFEPVTETPAPDAEPTASLPESLPETDENGVPYCD